LGERLVLQSFSTQWLALLFDQSLILIMRTDPNPNEILSVLDCKRPVMSPGSRGPKLSDLFEV
jgi:hypothetical protein